MAILTEIKLKTRTIQINHTNIQLIDEITEKSSILRSIFCTVGDILNPEDFDVKSVTDTNFQEEVGGGQAHYTQVGKHTSLVHTLTSVSKSTATRSLPEILHWKTCQPDHHFSHFLLAMQLPAYISTNIFLQNFHNTYKEVT